MTYEEFFEEVINSLSRDLIGEFDVKTKEDVRRYVESQENMVKEQYRADYKNISKVNLLMLYGMIALTALRIVYICFMSK